MLIDGEQLADFMIDFDGGVAVERTYALKRVDSDFFEPERPDRRLLRAAVDICLYSGSHLGAQADCLVHGLPGE